MEQLRSLKNEVRHLQEELQNLPMTKDSVRGSMVEFPYIERTMVISGIDEGSAGKLRRRLERKCAELQEKIGEMENWLDTIPDSEMRDVLRMKYRNGMKDKQIANELGYSRTAIAMKVQRFFR